MILHPNEASNHTHLKQYTDGTRPNPYQKFLTETYGVDLWSLQNIELTNDATCRRRRQIGLPSRSIIDRIAVGPDTPAGHIETIRDIWVTGSDHRPIFSRFAIPVSRGRLWQDSPSPLRLTRPEAQDPSFAKLREMLTEAKVRKPVLTRPITTDKEWLETYAVACDTFKFACDECFNRPRPLVMTPHEPAKVEQQLVHTLFVCKQARKSITDNRWHSFVFEKSSFDRDVILKYNPTESLPNTMTRLTRLAMQSRNELRRKQEESLKKSADRRYAYKVDIAIKTGSARKISPNQSIQIPPIIKDPDNGNKILSEPTQYLDALRRHCQNLYVRQEPPHTTKPWLDTTKSRSFRDDAPKSPLIWPQYIDSTALKTLLHKGNQKPAPGPEDWEKWALTKSGDDWLTTMSTLVNYCIKHNYFAPPLKRNYIIMIYKKGDTIDANNYRGIALAVTLQTVLASWFLSKIQEYANAKGLIPPSQIATQPQTRVSDLSNLLSSLDGLAKSQNTQWLALKRDQKKGFDYVHHSAFTDAVRFFGLPDSIISFDKARNDNVELRVKVRNKTSDPIFTSGLTKQGDAFSPLKYVLMTAMATWWLEEKYPLYGMKVNTNRDTTDRRSGIVTECPNIMIKILSSTDDTILLAKDSKQLQSMTYDMEWFQGAYNMETNWIDNSKTTLFILGPTKRRGTSKSRPRKLARGETERMIEDPEWIEEGSVNLATETVELRLPTDVTIRLTPTSTRDFLQTPLHDPATQFKTLLRIVKSYTIPRPGRALPIAAIRRIMHVSLGGMINARLQLQPVRRIDALKLDKAMAGKMKSYLGYYFHTSSRVLSSPINQGGFDFPNFSRMSAIASITNVHRGLNSPNTFFRNVATTALSQMQYTDNKGCPPLATHLATRHRRTARFLNVETAIDNLSALGLAITNKTKENPHDTNRHNITARIIRTNTMTTDDIKTLTTRLLSVHKHDRTISADNCIHWGTDGSSDVVDHLQPTRSAIGIAGPISFGARLAGVRATIQDAEILAIAIALHTDLAIRDKHNIPDETRTIVHSDHLSTVKRVATARTNGNILNITPDEASRHCLRFLQTIMLKHPSLSVSHVKAHTDKDDPYSKLNDKADKIAKASRSSSVIIGCLPDNLDQYFIHDASSIADHTRPKKFITNKWNERMIIKKDDDDNLSHNNEYRLTKASNGYAPYFLLMARSGQLPTPARMEGNHSLPFEKQRPEVLRLRRHVRSVGR